jgi:hypothetical protein
VPGDSVHIATGWYSGGGTIRFSNISLYGGYPLGLRGMDTSKRDHTANEVTLDGQHICFSLAGGNLPLSINDATGVTINGIGFKNGYPHGVKVVGSEVSFVDCRFQDNHPKTCLSRWGNSLYGSNGAGVYAEYSMISFDHSVFDNNVSYNSFLECISPFDCFPPRTVEKLGGGLYCYFCPSILISDCTFTDNGAESFGGAIGLKESTTVVEDCYFESNSAQSGGIIQSTNSSLTVVGSLFEENQSKNSVFEALGSSTNLVILDCVFRENTSRDGNIFSIESNGALIWNTEISKNKSSSGNMIEASGVVFEFLHSVISEGTHSSPIPSASAAIILHNCTSAVFRNNIHWNEVPEFDLEMTDLDISHSLVRGGWTAPSILVEDPRFVDAEMGDYRLGPDSPCIDYGIDAGVATDLLGVARPIDVPGVGQEGTGSEFDLGPYEALATGNPTWTPVPPTPTVTPTLIFDKVVDNRIDSMDLLGMVHEGFSSVSEDAWNSIFHFARYWQFDRN